MSGLLLPQRKIIPGFTRQSMAYNSFTGRPQARHTPRLVPGPANLLAPNQASFEVGTEGAKPTSGGMIFRDTIKAFHGSSSLRVRTPGYITREGVYIQLGHNVKRSTQYTATLRITGSGRVDVQLFHDPGIAYIASKNDVALSEEEWTFIELTGTTRNEDRGLYVYVRTSTSEPPQNTAFWIDAVQIEEGSVATPFKMPGVLADALLIEEGAVNIAENPGFLNGLEGWSTPPGLRKASAVDDISPIDGLKSIRVDGGYNHSWTGVAKIMTSGIVPGDTYTLSAECKCSPDVEYGGYVRIRKSLDGGNTWEFASAYATSLATSWERISIQYTVEPDVNALAFEVYSSRGNAAGQSVWLSCVQIEQGSYPTTFTVKERAPETLIIPTDGITLDGWTVDVLVYVDGRGFKRGEALVFPTVLNIRGGVYANAVRVYHGAEADPRWIVQIADDDEMKEYGTCSDEYTPDGWHLFTVKGTRSEVVVLIDGIRRMTMLDPSLPTAFGSDMYIGSYGGGGHHANAPFADVRVSSICRPDEDALALWESGTEFPVDQYTTYKLDLQRHRKLKF